jgi:hypothetical protein
MERPVHDRLIDIDISVPDFQVETAIRIGAYPSLVPYRSTLAPEIREWYEITGVALLTLGENHVFHGVLLPTSCSVNRLKYTVSIDIFTRYIVPEQYIESPRQPASPLNYEGGIYPPSK